MHDGIQTKEHREKMGQTIWLFMDLVQHANWKLGIVEKFKDKDAAARLGLPLQTIRNWRYQLRDKGYITCLPGHQSSRIVIHRWRDPSKVNPPMINIPEKVEAGEMVWGGYPKMDTQKSLSQTDPPELDTHPTSELDTPTLDSDSFSDNTTGSGENGETKVTDPAIPEGCTAKCDLLFEAVLFGYGHDYHRMYSTDQGKAELKALSGRIGDVAKALKKVNAPWFNVRRFFSEWDKHHDFARPRAPKKVVEYYVEWCKKDSQRFPKPPPAPPKPATDPPDLTPEEREKRLKMIADGKKKLAGRDDKPTA